MGFRAYLEVSGKRECLLPPEFEPCIAQPKTSSLYGASKVTSLRVDTQNIERKMAMY